MAITKHKVLEPTLWKDSESLYQEVLETLLSIAWAYIDNVRCRQGLNIFNSDVLDIFIYGSSTNYFYNKKSDIDICILFDMDKLKERNPDSRLQKSLTLFYYNWAMTHHCEIYGRKVDLSFEAVNSYRHKGHYRTGAMYSLLHKQWIYRPVVVSDKEFRELKKEADGIYREILKDFRKVKAHGFPMDEIQALHQNIHHSKNVAHDTNIVQPITSMYIAWRRIRNRGIMTELENHAIKHESEEFILKKN